MFLKFFNLIHDMKVKSKLKAMKIDIFKLIFSYKILIIIEENENIINERKIKFFKSE